jgi:hypothetical protein
MPYKNSSSQSKVKTTFYCVQWQNKGGLLLERKLKNAGN